MCAREVVTTRARRWVERLLAALERMPVVPEQLMELMREGECFEDEALVALQEATASDDDGEAIVASWILLLISKHSEWSPNEAVVERAESAIRCCLTEGPDDLRRLVCFFLRLGGVRPVLLSPLKSLMTHSDDEVSLTAACAVVQVEPQCKEARVMLRAAMENDEDDIGAAIAATSLLRAGEYGDDVIATVRTRLPRLGEAGMWAVLTAIKFAAEPAVALFDVAVAIAADETVSPELRRIAASVVGRLGRDRATTESALLAVMQAGD